MALVGIGAGVSLAATSSSPSGQIIRLCVNARTREVKQPTGTGLRCPGGYFFERFNKNLHPMPGPRGPQGPPGQTGPQGAPGVQTVTVPFNNVTTPPYDPSSIPAGQTGTYIATCASGQVDFSGGFSMASNPNLNVVQDKPTWYGLTNPTPTTTPASGWQVVIQNTGNSAVSPGVNVWAVCGTLDTTSSSSGS